MHESQPAFAQTGVALGAHGVDTVNDLNARLRAEVKRAFAGGLDFGRIQFSPGLLPGDMTGVTVWSQELLASLSAVASPEEIGIPSAPVTASFHMGRVQRGLDTRRFRLRAQENRTIDQTVRCPYRGVYTVGLDRLIVRDLFG